ncbi:hypothetical protein LTS18_009138 [Coniosporium uncinatum]|uniref:Uncharacterized protein n=1 Tax=Coniosporium uncinatum TaxID=93489 RepID=A0ACC3DML9_9PEZI|nr:hypothetical protein LTS18_009138 [Coniosporium uncinatum]
MDSDDEADTIPLVQQRVFGSSNLRRPIAFVRASNPILTTENAVANTPKLSAGDRYHPISLTNSKTQAGDRYLSIVMPNHKKDTATDNLPQAPATATTAEQAICDVCKLPIDRSATATPHEVTLAHLVSIQHSHPPHSIDRTSKGFSVLESHGWDPDSRTGLGATGQGILYPVRAKEKKDRYGIGIDPRKPGPVVKAKVEKLNAKQMQEKAKEDKKRHDRIQKMIYTDDKVLKYLSGSG